MNDEKIIQFPIKNNGERNYITIYLTIFLAMYSVTLFSSTGLFLLLLSSVTGYFAHDTGWMGGVIGSAGGAFFLVPGWTLIVIGLMYQSGSLEKSLTNVFLYYPFPRWLYKHFWKSSKTI